MECVISVGVFVLVGRSFIQQTYSHMVQCHRCDCRLEFVTRSIPYSQSTDMVDFFWFLSSFRSPRRLSFSNVTMCRSRTREEICFLYIRRQCTKPTVTNTIRFTRVDNMRRSIPFYISTFQINSASYIIFYFCDIFVVLLINNKINCLYVIGNKQLKIKILTYGLVLVNSMFITFYYYTYNIDIY